MKKTKFGLLLALMILCFATLISAAACSGTPDEIIDDIVSAATLRLDKTSVQLFVNEENTTVRATLTPADKTATYEWDIEDSKVASILPTQSACRITPKAQGTTILTVTVGDNTASCTVIVGGDRHVKLKAPSFTYDEETGIINITDTENKPEEVGGYELQFFKDDAILPSSSIPVTDGEAVDTRKVDKGDYTVKLVAKGVNSLFITSEPSESYANISIEKLMLYDLGSGDASCYLYDENGEANSLIPDRWAYFTYYWVTASEAYCNDGEVTFSFENNVSDNIKDYSYITQLIYSHGKTDSTKTYKMTLSIDVSQDCRISLNGKKVSLDKGENLVTVAFKPDKDPLKCLFKIEFAVSGEPFTIVDGTVKIKRVGNIVETTTQALKTPAFSFDDETKIITINDEVNNKYDVDYTIGFFENKNDASPVGRTVVKSGEVVDYSSVLTGEYYLKIMAASTGLPYTDSAWSAGNDNLKISVVNRRVDIKFGVSDVESVAKNNPGVWYYWYPATPMGGGGATTVDYVYMEWNDDGGKDLYMNYQSSGNYQPMKLFYTDLGYKKGDLYELTCTLTSPMAGKITINGIVVDIKEGVNDIRVIRVHPATNETVPNTITLQFGVGVWDGKMEGYIAGEITLENLKIAKTDPIPLEQINSFSYSEKTQSITVDDPNEYSKYPGANVSYEVGYFKGRTLTKSKIVAVDDGFEHPYLAPGDYTLMLRIVPASALYEAEGWFEPETPITVHIDNPDYREDIAKATSGTASENPGQWKYWNTNTTLSEMYIDAKGDIHVSYTFEWDNQTNAPKKSAEPVKLFYRDPSLQNGDLYKVTFNIDVPNDAVITVNKQKVQVYKGENAVSVTRKVDLSKHGENSCTVVIQFGSSDTSYLKDGTVVVSNIKWEVVEPETLKAFDFNFTETAKITATDNVNAESSVSKYVIGFFDSEGDLIKQVDLGKNNTRNGKTASVSTNGLTKGETYSVKIKVISSNSELYLDSDWFDAETPVTYTKS